ncbi:MAG: translocation/assembly module TamB domain-containing protein [Rikenellaceae bacterium]
MRKVIKILLKLIPTFILLLIFVPLMLSVLLTIPAIQSRLVDYATNFASEYLDSRVTISKLSVGALGRFSIGDVYVEDVNRDTLLYAQRIDLNIMRIGISSREVKLGSCTVSNGGIYLRQDADSVMNIKYLIEKLTPKVPAQKGTVISFDALEVRNFDVKIDLLNHRYPTYGVDYGDMQMLGMNAKIDDFIIDGPAISAQIKHLSCTEQSGFEVVDFSGQLYLSIGVVSLMDASIESRHSYMKFPYLSVVGASWSDYRNFVEMVDVSGQVVHSTLSSDDVAYFAPRLRDWGVTVSSLDAVVEGEIDDFTINIEGARFEERSSVVAELHISGLPDIENSHFEAQINELITTPADISKLSEGVVNKTLSPQTKAVLNKAKELKCSAKLEGTLSNFSTSFTASTAVGGAKSSLTMTTHSGDNRVVEGDVSIEGLRLGRLLNSNEIGSITLTSKIKGNLNDIYSSSFANGIIAKVDLRGESYHNISYGGVVENGEFLGRLASPNEGLDLEASADIDFNNEQLEYNFDLHLHDIDLKKLKVNKRDSVSRLSTHIAIQGRGNSIDKAVGDVTVVRGEYYYNADMLKGENIVLHANNNANLKTFEIESEYADVSYSSPDSYAMSWDYLRNSLGRYLPSLYDSLGDDVVGNFVDSKNSFSRLMVKAKDLTPLINTFASNVQLSKGSDIDLMYNSSTEDLSLAIKSPYMEFNSVLAINIDMGATNLSDSLSVYGSIKELLVGTRQFDNLAFEGGAVDDRVRFTAGYNDTGDASSATITAIAAINRDPLRGRMAKVNLLPSHFTHGDQMWDVKAQSIEIDRAGLLIDDFKIRNDQQELQIEGLASRSTNDTLRIDMQNFDLSILSSITEALGYNVEGVTNGDVAVSSALYNMRVEANVLLDSVSVNELPAPPMNIRAAWDSEMNQAEVSVTNRIKGDTLVRGYYIPSKVKYYGSLDVDSLHMGLLNAPLKGIISGTKGYADARLTISGERRNAVLEGYVDIVDMEAKVDYTNVAYKLPKARIEVNDNKLTCQNVEIYDPLGNQGTMTMSVDLQHLSNIEYRVRLNVTDFLALNTTLADNDLFYGKMFTSGVIDLMGNKVVVNMDITATTRDNSEFFMPLLGKSDISTAEFITFVTPKQQIDTTDISTIKRRFFESEKRNKTTGGSSLNINLALNVTPDAEFQLVIDPTVGDIIKGRGEGRINIRVNPKSNVFDMYGDYTITEGSYLFTLRNIINKRFVINPGSTIQWSGDPLDARLDIEAVYKLKTSLQPIMSDESTRSVPVDCTIYLTDRLMQPDVSFAVSLPTGDPEQQAVLANLLNDQETISRQFFYLMLANSFISDSATGATSDLGISTSAATGFELLTNQLSNWLSSSNYNVVIRYRPESDLTGDELDFGISRSLINNRLLVEVEGNYTNNDISSSGETDSEASSNFAGEAYVTWLIDRSGALKLKGFTQTIDTYDENQGLQETGVGIYYKESFDNFKDLKARVKSRFSRKGIGVKNQD